MKSLKLWLVACAASLTMGCGDVPVDLAGDGEEMRDSSQELTGCAATCEQGTVSCPSSTTSCSATHYVGVTCDGVAIACPPPTDPPLPTCSPFLPRCTSYLGGSCDVLNETVPCCVDEATYSWESSCKCVKAGATRPPYKWACAF